MNIDLTNTPFGDNFQKEHTQGEVHANSDFLNLKSLYRAQDHPHQKIAENIYIRTQAPSMNTQDSSWPIMRVVYIAHVLYL